MVTLHAHTDINKDDKQNLRRATGDRPDATADFPHGPAGRGSTAGESALQHCGPHLHRTYSGHRYGCTGGHWGDEFPHHSDFGVLGHCGRRRCAAGGHCAGTGTTRTGQSDSGQRGCAAGGLYGGNLGHGLPLHEAHSDLCRSVGTHHRLCPRLPERVSGGYAVCGAVGGTEHVYQYPGQAGHCHVVGHHRGRAQHRAGPAADFRFPPGSKGGGVGHRHLAGLQRGMDYRVPDVAPGYPAPSAALHALGRPHCALHSGPGRVTLYHGQHREPDWLCSEQQSESVRRHLHQCAGHHAERHAVCQRTAHGICPGVRTGGQLQLRARKPRKTEIVFPHRAPDDVHVQSRTDYADAVLPAPGGRCLYGRWAPDCHGRTGNATLPVGHEYFRVTACLPEYVCSSGCRPHLCVHCPAAQSVSAGATGPAVAALLGNEGRVSGRINLGRHGRHLLHPDFCLSISTHSGTYENSKSSIRE